MRLNTPSAIRRTVVGRDGTRMATKRTKTPNPSADPGRLRKETREWLTHNTIPNLREIAIDLENTGEDVGDLLEAIDELEALVKAGPGKQATRAKAEA